MAPFCQRKPLQIRPVGTPAAKNGQHEKSSPSGSLSAVSEIPTITPLLLLTGQATALFGPPSVPRGTVDPFTQRVATGGRVSGQVVGARGPAPINDAVG